MALSDVVICEIAYAQQENGIAEIRVSGQLPAVRAAFLFPILKLQATFQNRHYYHFSFTE